MSKRWTALRDKLRLRRPYWVVVRPDLRGLRIPIQGGVDPALFGVVIPWDQLEAKPVWPALRRDNPWFGKSASENPRPGLSFATERARKAATRLYSRHLRNAFERGDANFDHYVRDTSVRDTIGLLICSAVYGGGPIWVGVALLRVFSGEPLISDEAYAAAVAIGTSIVAAGVLIFACCLRIALARLAAVSVTRIQLRGHDLVYRCSDRDRCGDEIGSAVLAGTVGLDVAEFPDGRSVRRSRTLPHDLVRTLHIYAEHRRREADRPSRAAAMRSAFRLWCFLMAFVGLLAYALPKLSPDAESWQVWAGGSFLAAAFGTVPLFEKDHKRMRRWERRERGWSRRVLRKFGSPPPFLRDSA